ncbi:MAG: hypothetical protein AAB115_07345 [Pseudomonadota bacterium]
MPETCIFNFSQFAGGVFAALLGALVGYFSADRVARRAVYRNALGTFRAAFIKEITLLSSPAFNANGSIKTHSILVSAFDKHSEAVATFRFYIPDDKIAAFNKAWEQYQGGEEFKSGANRVNLSDKNRILMPYVAQSTEEENRILAIENIHALLQFTKS